jgi:hypothetical protein
MTVKTTPFIAAKRRMLAVLKRRGITSVSIDYDGEGDSGQIAGIGATDAQNRPASLLAPVRVALRSAKPDRYPTLEDALEEFAWSLLAHYHGGFENNDGGFGTIHINVAKGSVCIEHNDRFSDVIETTTEV